MKNIIEVLKKHLEDIDKYVSLHSEAYNNGRLTKDEYEECILDGAHDRDATHKALDAASKAPIDEFLVYRSHKDEYGMNKVIAREVMGEKAAKEMVRRLNEDCPPEFPYYFDYMPQI